MTVINQIVPGSAVLRCLFGLVAGLALALANAAQANNCNLERLDPETMTGVYTMMASPTTITMGGLSDTRQGTRTAPAKIWLFDGQLRLQGWPTASGDALLKITEVGDNWAWPSAEGMLGSEDVGRTMGCPIQALPGFEVSAKTIDADGIEVTHVMRLVVVNDDKMIGEWTFTAPGSGVVGRTTLYISR
jgi:hypothetical protein